MCPSDAKEGRSCFRVSKLLPSASGKPATDASKNLACEVAALVAHAERNAKQPCRFELGFFSNQCVVVSVK